MLLIRCLQDNCYVFGLRIPIEFCSNPQGDDSGQKAEGISPAVCSASSYATDHDIPGLPVALQSAVKETLKRISVAFPGRKISQVDGITSDVDSMKALDDLFRDFDVRPSTQSSSSSSLANLVAQPTSEMNSSTAVTVTKSSMTLSTNAGVQLLPRPPPPKESSSGGSIRSSSSGIADIGAVSSRHRKLIATLNTASSTASDAHEKG